MKRLRNYIGIGICTILLTTWLAFSCSHIPLKEEDIVFGPVVAPLKNESESEHRDRVNDAGRKSSV